MFLYKNVINVAIHVFIWGLLFSINYLFIDDFRIKIDMYFQIKTWLIYLFVFYVNYLFLIPYILFKKKVLIYVIASFLLVIGSYLIKDNITRTYFQKQLNQNELEFQIGKHEFDHSRPPLPQGYEDKKWNKPDSKFDHQFGSHPPKKPKFDMMLFGIYGISLIYTISLLLSFIQKWKRDEKRNAEIEKENISSELTFLKQQINPHFLFNSINSIYSLSITKSDLTADAILKLSSILRYMLYETQSQYQNLSEEIMIISDYIELQKLRLTDKVQVTFDIIGNTEKYKLEPYILIPLIENAFKHGADNINNSFIEIIIQIKEELLIFTVRNKIVTKINSDKKNSGIGLKNIKRRLELLYENEHSLEIKETKDIFYLQLQLKLRK
ncbi:MAG: hypothetical protein A2X12_07750 [Bacteroidetes bacterium GWE2_29_8]|nr:MAG: hypothetical protein A2X12_07750 [Bacteroidetes bacterium GWE2_29_8]